MTNAQDRAVRTVAGALRYTQYDFFRRSIVKRIARETGVATDATHDIEYTDRATVENYVDEPLDGF